jgi:excisionase family DNA binding protein
MNQRKGAPSGLSPQEKSEVMTLRDVATYLECHYTTVFRLLKAGDLAGFRLGSDWRFLRSDIDKWIAERQVRPYAPGKSGSRGRGKRGAETKR